MSGEGQDPIRPAPRKRVMVVDDSVVVRQLVKEALAGIPGMDVETAGNGATALEKASLAPYDLIILDIEMPGTDGFSTLSKLKERNPRPAVFMFSASGGQDPFLKALSHGAADFIPKPTAMSSGAESLESLRRNLLPKVRAYLRLPPDGTNAPMAPARADAARMVGTEASAGRRARMPGTSAILAIASSTGGPQALSTVLPALAGGLTVPAVLVQHMPMGFTAGFSQRIGGLCGYPVLEGRQDAVLPAGSLAIAPAGAHMAVRNVPEGVRINLNADPPENSCRPAADVLFRSVAAEYGPQVLAVVLTGMGQDGLRGCEAIKAAGGRVIVQDRNTSVVWGMPKAVHDAGLADEVLPLDRIGARIRECLPKPVRGGI